MSLSSQPLFLFGAGYSGQYLARIWQGPVYASYRSPSSRAEIEQLGLIPVDAQSPEAIAAIIDDAHILVSPPPDAHGCPALRALHPVIAQAASVTYLSTTGVYGDRAGGWVFETTPPRPGQTRSQRRLAAEQDWIAARPDICIARLPGIYGPGRSAFDRLAQGTARRIIKPQQVFSRIHVEDLATALLALIGQGANGIFHICDDVAAPPQDVIAFAATCQGSDAGPEISILDPSLSDMTRSFYAECKRVSNAKIKAVTGWVPRYPSYREGLKAINAGVIASAVER